MNQLSFNLLSRKTYLEQLIQAQKSITDKYGLRCNINMYQTQLKISCEMQSTVATWEIRRE